MIKTFKHHLRIFLAASFYLLVAFPLVVSAASLSLEWVENDPDATGYRLFQRVDGQSYNYSNSIYSGSEAAYTVNNLNDGVTYFFVVRAYNADQASVDSNEIEHTPGDSQPVFEPDYIIDESDAGATEIGSWVPSGAPNPYGSKSLYSNDVASYRFTENLQGRYIVYFWWTSHASRCTDVPVDIYDGSELIDTVYVNQLSNGGQWNALGTYQFADTPEVEIRSLGGGCSTAADAIGFTLTDNSGIVPDSDGDGAVDSLDAFPDDPNEWIDTDADGTGNNSDPDDDNDGMPDEWENEHGLDPLTDDANLDLDGDGVINIDEYEDGSDPSQVPGNDAPATPELLEPIEGVTVGLTPTLTTHSYTDPDGDAHGLTQFQIATDVDFSILILDRTSSHQLTQMAVMDLILDSGTTYYWRARYIDSRNGKSHWSAYASFITQDAAAAGDVDGNGVLDSQEADMSVDLDENGTPDLIQSDLKCVNTTDDINPHVAVKKLSTDTQIVGVRALTLNGLGLSSTQPEHMTGLISFKLFLEPGVTTTSITVYFSEPAPDDAEWYKFSTEDGWEAYPNVVFSPDRKSMTLLLEDGGAGDQDGVCNGVIVDPSGLGYQRTLSDGSVSTVSDQTSCFISTPMSQIEAQKTHSFVLMLLVAIGAALCVVVERRSKYKK